MKRLNFIEKFLFFINSLVAVLLLTTYALPYIDPEKLPSVAILSLAYPLLLLTNIFFIIMWMIKLKAQFLLSTIIIVFGFSHLNAFFSFDKKENLKQDDIKILTYNVRQFNRYNWIQSPTIKQDICDFINEQNPDIICFQEYVNSQNLDINIPRVFTRKSPSSGLAIYSKYKVINSGAFNFKGTSNDIIFADLKINNEIVRVYNTHLQSFSIDVNKDNYGDKDKEALLKRFRRIFRIQAYQIKALKKHISECPYRTIIAGDFNNTAFSWNYHELITDRNDAFVEAGIGFGKTHNYFFPFRIDFILPEKGIETASFTTFDVKLSDHYPIMARLNLNNKK